MGNRTIGDFTRSRLVVPDLAPDMSGANLMNMVSKQAGHAADVAIHEWQQAEVATATMEGEEAGSERQVAYRPAGTLTADAFNAAAQKSYANGIQMRTTSEMMRLKQTNLVNPEGYQTQSDEFITNITDEVKRNGGEALARQVEGKLRLEQQAQGYKVAKEYTAMAAEKFKGDIAARTQQLKTDAYISAGEIFSKDPSIKNAAMNKFLDNQRELSTNLHAVVDGKPLYSGEAIQKRERAFHSEFFQKAMQNYVTDNDIDMDELDAIRKGTFALDFPEVGTLNMVEHIGTEAYQTKVINYTMDKIREKEATRAKEDVINKEKREMARDAKDIEVLTGYYQGEPTTAASIKTMVGEGKISSSVAKSALKMLNDPNPISDDYELSASLKVRQIRGEDISAIVKDNSYRLSGKTYETLLTNAAKAEMSMQNEDEKWIVREMVKKNQFGIEDPMSLRLASDVVDSYRQKVKDGTSPELAIEEVRTTMSAVKSNENRRLLSSVPLYTILAGNKINIIATRRATKRAAKDGLISEDMLTVELRRLKLMEEETDADEI